MSDCFVGEIRMFGGTFAPMDWAFCDGSTMPISQYDVLYSLIGTTYGGDGVTNFKLPDLRGRIPVHMGQGPGLTNRAIGTSFGTEAERCRLRTFRPIPTSSARAATARPLLRPATTRVTV